MQFISVYFIIFIIFSVILFYCTATKYRYIALLICNIAFYYSWSNNISDFLSLIFVILITYISALFINKKKNKFILAFSIILSISPLFIFKYSDFILTNLNNIFNGMGLSCHVSQLNLISPIGISFFTFQSVGYLIDVYNNKAQPEVNLLKYSVFISFFPTITSGPIERSNNLLKQICEQKNPLSFDSLRKGIILFLYGAFLKLTIASRLTIIVDTVFSKYTSFGGSILFLCAIAYTFQIYCDFSSYSLMAKGISNLFGFDIIDNFDVPYFAESIQDFWRRWHISLSTWFRDYVYIPLGGNRCTPFRKNLNLLITFVVSGIWHGANWTFVIWGSLHGIYQIIGNITKSFRNNLREKWGVKEDSFAYHIFRKLTVFLYVAFAWIFFRANSLSQAISYIKIMFTDSKVWQLFDGTRYNLGLSFLQYELLLISLVIMMFVDYQKYKTKQNIDDILLKQHWFIRIICVALLFVLTIIIGLYGPGYSSQDFIYFNF